jgi:hypothetical protein
VLGGREYLMWQDNGDGLGALWHETTNAILAALPSLDTREIDAIGRAAAEK